MGWCASWKLAATKTVETWPAGEDARGLGGVELLEFVALEDAAVDVLRCAQVRQLFRPAAGVRVIAEQHLVAV